MDAGDARARDGARQLVVGIVGGMGPLATHAFHGALIRETAAGADRDHLHVVVDSDPAIPDRTAFVLGEGEDPRPAIVRAGRRLADAGAELLVMPCNTANLFVEEIEAEVGRAFVRWLEAAADAVAERRPRAVGLLATTGTLRGGAYQRLFERRGIAVVEPDEDEQRHVMSAIYGRGGVKGGDEAAPENREQLARVGRALAGRGADVLLLACTELPIALPAADAAWPVPAVDPAVAAARAVIRAAGGVTRDRHEREPRRPAGAAA